MAHGKSKSKRPQLLGPFSLFKDQVLASRELTGVVPDNQLGHAGVDATDLDSAVQPGHAQMGISLNLLPVGLKLVLVAKIVK